MTAGPVLVADGIGYSDRALIMRSCREDGLLLKPSKPMTAMDGALIAEAFAGEERREVRDGREEREGRGVASSPAGVKAAQGPVGQAPIAALNRTEVWGTHSHIGGMGNGAGAGGWWFHVFAADVQTPLVLTREDVLGLADPRAAAALRRSNARYLAYRMPSLMRIHPNPLNDTNNTTNTTNNNTNNDSGGDGSSGSVGGGHGGHGGGGGDGAGECHRASHLTLRSLDREPHGLTLLPKPLPDFDVWHFAPVGGSGWALLGELSKWVPVSPQRVLGVEDAWGEEGEGAGVLVRVRGTHGERVRMHAARARAYGTGFDVAVGECVVGMDLGCTIVIPSAPIHREGEDGARSMAF